MRKFAICNKFAVPVDEITGIRVNREKSRLEVRTEDYTYRTGDKTEAIRFLHTLEEGGALNAASVDDMERHIELQLS